MTLFMPTPTIHRDGTVTYWSAPLQTWVTRGHPSGREIYAHEGIALRRLLTWQQRDEQRRASEEQWDESDRRILRRSMRE